MRFQWRRCSGRRRPWNSRMEAKTSMNMRSRWGMASKRPFASRTCVTSRTSAIPKMRSSFGFSRATPRNTYTSSTEPSRSRSKEAKHHRRKRLPIMVWKPR